jgi:hypothetical protein
MYISTNFYSVKSIIFLLLFTIVMIFQGCSANTSSQNKNDSNINATTIPIRANTDFAVFLKKFKVLSLPLTIKTLEIEVDSSKKLNSKDNVFIKSEYPDEIYAYGMLPDTETNYKIIWLEPAEVEIPVLTTFTKAGKKIKEEELGVGGCGSDCGFNCKEYITINTDLSIFSRDSIKSTDCDTSGNIIESTAKKYMRYKTGKVLKSGKIEMTKTLEKPVN